MPEVLCTECYDTGEVCGAVYYECGGDSVAQKAKPINHRLPWTTGEESDLMYNFRLGKPLADLARRLGRSPRAVANRLQALGEVELVRDNVYRKRDVWANVRPNHGIGD